jgi:hypothetical protein
MYCHSALLLLLLLLEVLVYTITVGQKKRTDDIYAMTLKNKNNKNSQKNSEKERSVRDWTPKFWGRGDRLKGTLIYN